MKNQALIFDEAERQRQDPERIFQSLFEARFAHRPRLAGSNSRRPQAGAGLIGSSPVGAVLVCVSNRGIVMIRFIRQPSDLEYAVTVLSRNFDVTADNNAARSVERELSRFVSGDESALRSPLDLSLVKAPFHRRVLELLLKVGPGAILSYASLAAWAGKPQAPRAVGGVMHDNPIPVYVPCHRVVRSDLSLGGYGGGLDVKRRLLQAEGFSFTPAGLVAQDGAVWGNRNTGVFCRPGCRALARANRANTLLFRDAQRAERAGMRACSFCGGKWGE